MRFLFNLLGVFLFTFLTGINTLDATDIQPNEMGNIIEIICVYVQLYDQYDALVCSENFMP